MRVLLDTNSAQWSQAPSELGDGLDVGELLTPLTRRAWRGAPYGIDNGAFARFDAAGFRRLLARMLPHRDQCLFVAAPDIVGSARRTLEVFDGWHRELAGWPRALVAQDGLEDLPIPWPQLSAVFVGGSTEFKLSKSAADVIRAAKALGKWVHVGRVNTPARLDRFIELGADSIDGTGISRYSHMREAMAAPTLYDGEQVAT